MNLAGQPPPRSQSLTSWTPATFPKSYELDSSHVPKVLRVGLQPPRSQLQLLYQKTHASELKLDILLVLVENYEQQYRPIDPPDPFKRICKLHEGLQISLDSLLGKSALRT